MVRKKFLSGIFFTVLITFPFIVNSQDGGTPTVNNRNDAVKVYLDCRRCDMNYTRREIPFVNYVRDVKEAEVYVLVTTQQAGNGGDQYTYTFSGQYDFEGMNDTLVYNTNPNQTRAEIREKSTNMLELGLIRYVARTPLADEISVTHNENLETAEVKDRWNNWLFELETSPRFNTEESYKRIFLSNSLNITKITPDIKLEIELDQSINRQKFIEDSVTSIYTRSNKSIRTLFVKSLNDHWSAGLRVNVQSATNPNYDLNLEVMPAVEYDIYPYSESTHKQLRINYSAGYQFSNYIDTTLFNKLKNELFRHELRVAYQIQEKWGWINVSLSGSNYFHDWSKNRLELNGFIRLRILKGLSLSVNGEIAYINDQLNLRKGDLSEAERLLRLKEQATNYSIGGSIGLSYTFGSIYNNVVNPRFDRGGGGYNRFY
jgi:hypothetical protein